MISGDQARAMKQMSRYKVSVNDGLMQCDVQWCRMYDRKDSQKPVKNHHHSCYELHYVYEGKAGVVLPGNAPLVIDRDHFTVLSPFRKHSTEPASADLEKLLYRFSIKTDSEFISSALERINRDCEVFSAPPSMRKLVEVMLENASAGARGTGTCMTRLFECFLIEAMRVVSPDAGPDDADGDAREEEKQNRTSEAVKFIDDNITAMIKCEDVAKKMNMSLRHLNRLTNEKLGMPVSRLITLRRLGYIKDLLRRPELNLRDIADMTGFESEFSLNRFFKQHEGMTVGAYRSSEVCMK